MYLSNVWETSDTPLTSAPYGSKWRWIGNTNKPTELLLADHNVGSKLVLCPDDISAQEMRSGGATELLLGGIDYGKTKLLGRCCSNQMMTCLHMSNHPFLQNFSFVMMDHRDYTQVSAT